MRVRLYTNLFIILFCFSCNGYGINYKYEGILAHSFDRFYIVTKFILPTMNDLKLSPVKYDKESKYLHDLDNQNNDKLKKI